MSEPTQMDKTFQIIMKHMLETVQLDAPCLDCGFQMRVEMKDGVIQKTEPEGLFGYTSVPFKDWFNDLPYS